VSIVCFKSHRDCFIICPDEEEAEDERVSNPIGTALLLEAQKATALGKNYVSNPIGTALL